MTALKTWDGSAWATVEGVGEQGPAGPPGVGALLAVQRQWGRSEAHLNHSAGVIWANPTGTELMRFQYTPTVPCWWDVMADIGLITCNTAAYVYRIVSLNLNPPDADGLSQITEYEMQHINVQTYTFCQMQHTFKLNAGVAYTVEANFSFSGGAWQIYQGPAQLNMEGKVFSR